MIEMERIEVSFIKSLNNSKKKNIWSNSINNNYEDLHSHQPSNNLYSYKGTRYYICKNRITSCI